jgi:negative regulator of replication initiation
MRTTIDIDDPVLEELKRFQAREGGSLGRVASDLLAQALKQAQKPRAQVPAFRWTSRPMQARVDLADRDAIWDAIDRSR